MHGLILDRAIPFQQTAPDRLVGQLDAGSFGGRWPSALALTFDWRLAGGAIILSIEVRNVGDRITPVGIGWHPYLALPSGDRSQARLRLPARLRAEVDNYDEVLPTGRLSPTAGTAYDFGCPEGAALGDLYLDDCFTDLIREDGRAVVELRDPKAGVGIRATSPSPAVKAIQVYAPPSQAFVVVEPQFNLADPFGDEWPEGVDTGMARLRPGEVARYEASLSAFTLGNR